ncbi:MAG: hypothetical protein ACRDNZ_22855, partial [Streptosporangiaceae bacterium]
VYSMIRAIRDAPGLPGGRVPPAFVKSWVFTELSDLLTDGVTSPSPAVVVQAMSQIPGATTTLATHDYRGQPALEVTVAGSENSYSIFLDPGSYAVLDNVINISGADFHIINPPRKAVLVGSSVVWTAYYDAQGNKI